MELTLDDIVTMPLADHLRAVLREWARHGCDQPPCRERMYAACDALLDEWLARTRG